MTDVSLVYKSYVEFENQLMLINLLCLSDIRVNYVSSI
jgi:hypothetical protein